MLPKWLKIARKRRLEALEPPREGERSPMERLEAVEVRQGEIERQWAEVLDKINRWAAREAARRRKEAGEALDAMASETAPADSPAAGVHDKAQLRRLARQRFLGGQAG